MKKVEEKKHSLKKKQKIKIITLISAFITLSLSFYFLILPAITMEAKPICGDPEHLHTQECFEEPVEINFICGLEEHVHDESCYDENNVLTCLRQEHQHNGHCIQAIIIKDENEIVSDLVHGKINTDEITLPESTSEPVSVDDNLVVTSEIEDETLSLDGSDLSDTDILEQSLSSVKSEKMAVNALQANAPINFKNWITYIKLQVAHDGKNFIEYNPSDPLYSYQSLKFIINYDIPAYSLNKDNRTITYQLPYNVTLREESSGKVFSRGGNIIGDYTINASGVISIVFFEEFADKNAKGEVIYGDIMFISDVNSFETKKDGDIEFIFKDDLVIELHVVDKVIKSGDLYIEKSQSDLSDDGYIDYTIKVYTNEGTSDKVTITDNMSNVLYYSDFTIKDSKNRTVNVQKPQRNTNTFTYDLPKLGANDYYLITYKAKIASEFENSTYLDNHVRASSKDSEGYEIEATTSVSLYYSVDIISKTGTITDDGFIQWEIVVNKDKANIGGYKISDTFNNIPFENEVELIGPNGSSKIKLPYTFPPNDTNTYTIRYKTEQEKIHGGNSAYNRVVLEKGDKSYNSEKYVYIGESAPNILEKTGKDIKVDENGDVILTWNLNVEIFDPVPAGQEISDFTSSNHYFTANQVRAFLAEINKLNIGYEYKLYGEGGWWPEYTQIDERAKYGSIRIKFTEPLRSKTKINFDYQTTAHISDINKPVEYTNKFSVGNDITETSIDFEPEIKKYDPLSSGDPTRHTLTEDRKIIWAIDFTVPEAEFDIEEIIPDFTTLEYIKFSGRNLTYTTNDGKIIIHFDKNFVQKYAKSKQTIEVCVKIDEDCHFDRHSALLSTCSFKNNVSLIRNDGTESHSSHTQIIEDYKDEKEIKIITKKYNGLQWTDTLPYTLEINENAKDRSEDDFLKVEDVMTYNGNSDYVLLYLAPASIEAFEVLDNGSTRKLTDEEFSYKYTYDISKASGRWGECTNNVIFTIPDGMHVRISYFYRINGKVDKDTWYAFKNSASVTNAKDDTLGDYTNISVAISESAATAYTEGIELLKIDEDTGKPLPNVYFRLYKYNDEKKKYELVTDEKNNNNDLYKTNEDGIIIFKEMCLNTAYYLEEIFQPENYIKLKPYYFVIHDDDIENYPPIIPDDFEGTTYRRGMNITLTNKKPTAKVRVKKRWADFNGIEDDITGDSAKINLYQMTQDDGSYNQGINTDGVVSFKYNIGPNEWATWDTGASEYLAGTVIRLTITCTNKNYTPDNIVVQLNGQTIGGSQNAVYVEVQHENWTENVLQHKDYIYDFTVSETSDLNVLLNYYNQDDITYNMEAIYVPSQSSGGTQITDIPYKTVILNEANNWEYEWTDLPTVGMTDDGEVVHYFYTIDESDVQGYVCAIDCIEKSENYYEYVVTNKRTTQPNYNMPATGGIGVKHLYAIGTIVIGFALYKIIMAFIKKYSDNKTDDNDKNNETLNE